MKRCTSGRAIPAIGVGQNNPCGRALVSVAYTGRQGHTVVAWLCPFCDGPAAARK